MQFYRDQASGHHHILDEHVTLPGDLTQTPAERQASFTERYAKRAGRMSAIIKEYALSTLKRAVGNFSGVMTQVQVANELKIEPSTIKCRIAFNRNGEALVSHKAEGERRR